MAGSGNKVSLTSDFSSRSNVLPKTCERAMIVPGKIASTLEVKGKQGELSGDSLQCSVALFTTSVLPYSRLLLLWILVQLGILCGKTANLCFLPLALEEQSLLSQLLFFLEHPEFPGEIEGCLDLSLTSTSFFIGLL